MNQFIKIRCPAKINLTLEIINKREDGFHNIKSIMQTISLYDYLSINIKKSKKAMIHLSGNNHEIPYNEKNLVYKAVILYLSKAMLNKVSIDIYIEKHIPVAAGLAGGSTDAAGTLYGLNQLFKALTEQEIAQLCAQLGSDLNVCYQGGCLLATSRGEITKKLPNLKAKVTLIKPKNLGISAKEAYQKYVKKIIKPKHNNTEKMIKAINNQTDIIPYLYNDLEYALLDDYQELKTIKESIPESIMSGSGSTYFVLKDLTKVNLNDDYEIFNNLHFISEGISKVAYASS